MAADLDVEITTFIAELEDALLNGDYKLDPAPQRVLSNYYGQSVPADLPCGQLSFRLVSAAPKYANSNGRVAMRQPCAVDWWDVIVEVKIIRCIPTIDDNGEPPAPAKVKAAADQIMHDMSSILKTATANKRVYAVGPWAPSPALGNASGGAWMVTFRADAQPC
jgi:hypothetical protein